VPEFLTIPELKFNPLVKSVIDIFYGDANCEVDLQKFVLGFAEFVLNKEGDYKRMLKFASKIYDIDQDRYISSEELQEVLRMIVGKNLKDDQVQQIANLSILYLRRGQHTAREGSIFSFEKAYLT
jgi:serine/threonine-protein phosphatase 2B regulatory subunit